jgi:hypothetical protein
MRSGRVRCGQPPNRCGDREPAADLYSATAGPEEAPDCSYVIDLLSRGRLASSTNVVTDRAYWSDRAFVMVSVSLADISEATRARPERSGRAPHPVSRVAQRAAVLALLLTHGQGPAPAGQPAGDRDVGVHVPRPARSEESQWPCTRRLPRCCPQPVTAWSLVSCFPDGRPGDSARRFEQRLEPARTARSSASRWALS